MTVGDLCQLLAEYPPEFPVFVRPGDGEAVVPVRDGVMELVHSAGGAVLPDGFAGSIPVGFEDAVVLYPRPIREEQ